MKKYIVSMVIAATSLSASAQKSRQVDTLLVTTIPEMHCSGCEERIKENIRFVKGVKSIQTSVPEQKVTIIYQKNKAKYEDFVKAFDRLGYEIEQRGNIG